MDSIHNNDVPSSLLNFSSPQVRRDMQEEFLIEQYLRSWKKLHIEKLATSGKRGNRLLHGSLDANLESREVAAYAHSPSSRASTTTQCAVPRGSVSPVLPEPARTRSDVTSPTPLSTHFGGHDLGRYPNRTTIENHPSIPFHDPSRRSNVTNVHVNYQAQKHLSRPNGLATETSRKQDTFEQQTDTRARHGVRPATIQHRELPRARQVDNGRRDRRESRTKAATSLGKRKQREDEIEAERKERKRTNRKKNAQFVESSQQGPPAERTIRVGQGYRTDLALAKGKKPAKRIKVE